MLKKPGNCSRFFGISELLLKYDFLFIALIFCTIITFPTFKRFGAVGKPRSSRTYFGKTKLKLKKKEFENSQPFM